MSVKRFTATKVTPTAGGFTAVASTADLDRDGEIIDPGAFAPLPASVPLLAYHNMADPIGTARPRYEGARLLIDATFASTARAQEIRTLVGEGAITAVSVGFMAATRTTVDGVPHVTKGELIEVSTVPIPSNRAAMILEARSVKMPPADVTRELLALMRADLAIIRAESLADRPVRPVDPFVRDGFTPNHARANKGPRR